MNKFTNEISSERINEKYMSPDDMVENIKKHLYDKNGIELYNYTKMLLYWIRSNYNVEPTDYNGGCADGSISFATTTAVQTSTNINNINGIFG